MLAALLVATLFGSVSVRGGPTPSSAALALRSGGGPPLDRLAADGGSAPRSGTGPSLGGFSGSWERDPDRSDDGEAKMREAFARMQAEMERRGGGIPGGPPPGGGGPAGGAGERRARPGQVPDELYIEQDRGELRVDDGERLQIFYLDGQKHRRQLPNGEKLETVATLQGNVVLIDEKMKRGKIQRKLELLDDGKTIVWTLLVDLDRMKEPVQIRTVYERVE